MHVVAAAFGAVVWLGLVWYVAPLLSGRIESAPERLRQAIVVVVGIGFVLGFVRALDPFGVWAAAAILVVFRLVRHRRMPPAATSPRAPLAYAAVAAATALGAWPSFVRPVTDGDSLIYHLPNAASWVHAHSIFVTDTHYWWYPGGSELFAAVMLCVGGLPLLPLAGAAAYALLGVTAVGWCLNRGLSDWEAALLTLLLLTSFVAVVQSGDLQNDVWLAAFAAAGLARLAGGDPPARGTLAVLALLKPDGWLYAGALALGVPRRARRVPWLALGALLLWIARDAALAPTAMLPLPPFPDPAQNGTSIAAHGIEGVRVLFASALRDGASTFALLCAAVLCALRNAFKRAGFAALFALAVWFVLPYGFESDGIAQLAGGFTLRFGLPALVVGSFAAAAWLGGKPRVPRGVAMLGCALAVALNVRKFMDLYWNDANTHFMAIVALAALGFAWGLGRLRPGAAPALLTACGLFAALLGARHVAGASVPLGYYRDGLGEASVSDSLPAFLTRLEDDENVVAVGFPLGIVDELAPRVRAIDGRYAGDVCRQARAAHALLVVHEPGAHGTGVRASLAACGRVVWHDALDEAVAP